MECACEIIEGEHQDLFAWIEALDSFSAHALSSESLVRRKRAAHTVRSVGYETRYGRLSAFNETICYGLIDNRTQLFHEVFVAPVLDRRKVYASQSWRYDSLFYRCDVPTQHSSYNDTDTDCGASRGSGTTE